MRMFVTFVENDLQEILIKIKTTVELETIAIILVNTEV